ncbi:MAG: DctP family TRAP transporter solute-binding subunit [Methylobacteriaceae bacterium]|jgi:tripartite ATP-independent transporter DctP family solute receptor|nr:DctP family TRAP transporter solute-binding subunit [Methylobacteriaceae bacterium]
MNRLFSLALATSAVALMSFTAAEAQTVTLRLSNVTTQAGKDGGVYFIEKVKEATKGEVIIEHYPDNQLGDDRTVVESTIFGDIDLVVSSTTPMATIFPDFNMFDAPFLFLSLDAVYKGLDGEIGQKVLAEMEGKGLVGLAWWENGFRNFTNNKVAAKVPDDVKSMKIRVMQSDVQMAAWAAIGVNPTPIAFTELFTAMQQGTVDGQENPLQIIDGNKFQEVQKYLSLTQHGYVPFVLCMNPAKFKSLKKEHQDAIVNAAKESVEWQRNRVHEQDAVIINKVQKEGMTVVELTPEQKALWQQKVIDGKVYDLVKSKMEHPEYFDAMVK